jgi:calcineurin-like phosphoesterase family protein
MARALYTADLHLGHANIHKYRKELGFETADEHHNWVFNRIKDFVTKRDTLYLLGDIAFTEEWLLKLKELPCKLILILGNHDTDKADLFKLFPEVYSKVYSMYNRGQATFTHCPIHRAQFRGKLLNVHGHLHGDSIMKDGEIDKEYFSVSLEQRDYLPVDSSVIKQHIEDYLK